MGRHFLCILDNFVGVGASSVRPVHLADVAQIRPRYAQRKLYVRIYNALQHEWYVPCEWRYCEYCKALYAEKIRNNLMEIGHGIDSTFSRATTLREARHFPLRIGQFLHDVCPGKKRQGTSGKADGSVGSAFNCGVYRFFLDITPDDHYSTLSNTDFNGRYIHRAFCNLDGSVGRVYQFADIWSWMGLVPLQQYIWNGVSRA